MKKGILKLMAVLVLGAATLQSCSVDNHYRRGRYNNRWHGDDRHHHYDNRYDGYRH